MKKKLAVLFPGVRYGEDCPLLYYPGMKYEEKGYELVTADYQMNGENSLEHLKDFAEVAEGNVKKQLENMNLSQYEKIVFVEKSIGTVIGMKIEDELELEHVTHVVLTPIHNTVSLLNEKRNISYMATGNKDNMIDLSKLRQACKKYKIPLTVIKDVGHRLEKGTDTKRNLKILQEIMKKI